MSDDSNNGGTPDGPWTILRTLEWVTGYFESKGIDTARLDAELLMSDVLDLERIQLYAQFDRPMVPEEQAPLRAYVKRRAAREPIAYILGSEGFWTIELEVDERVLVPRSDTELVVEKALELLDEDAAATVVDVGTGSGAIALALADERPKLRVAATDRSVDALALARHNAERLGLDDRVTLACGDLFAELDVPFEQVDMVVSNPPYIAESERDDLMPEVRDYEPLEALFAGPDGLGVIRRLVPAAFERLVPDGYLLCEIGYRQGKSVRQIFEEAGFVDVVVHRDYNGRDRVVQGRHP